MFGDLRTPLALPDTHLTVFLYTYVILQHRPVEALKASIHTYESSLLTALNGVCISFIYLLLSSFDAAGVAAERKRLKLSYTP